MILSELPDVEEGEDTLEDCAGAGVTGEDEVGNRLDSSSATIE